MAQQRTEISDKLQRFIGEQKIFFVATATDNSRINLSPKGMDSLQIISPVRVVWLNVTGSGNETAAHIAKDGRMTIMFTAFTGKPLILRLYGTAKAVHKNDSEWDCLAALFPPLPGARQIFDLQIELVQTSCGMGTPFFAYEQEREQLNNWANKKGENGIKEYWQKYNQQTIDGVATGIMEKNT